jgi:hypothetical protein
MATLQKPGLGMNSWVGFGQESSFGTAVTPTEYIEIESETLMKEVQRIEAMSILRRGTVDNKIISGAVQVGGEVSFPVQFDGWLLLAYQAFGSYTTSQPDVTNAPTAYKHSFTLADVLPAALTFEVFRDTTQFTTEPSKSFVYSGCKISKMEFACAVNEVLKCSMSVMGRNEARASRSTATPSFSNSEYAVFTEAIVSYNGNDVEASNFSISLENNLAYRYKLGSAYTREPSPDSKLMATGSFDMEFQSWDQYDDFVNTTERALTVTFTGPLIAGSIYKTIKFTCAQIFIEKVKLSLDKPGRIMMTIDYRAFRNTAQTSNEILLEITNTNASI